ncbi:MAG: hypothetical protein K9N49_02300 [Candidatus Marinimicrobia bacterium]|nr:hypothetical protein [Candidatus Neomarinimicrobiota bacterium]
MNVMTSLMRTAAILAIAASVTGCASTVIIEKRMAYNPPVDLNTAQSVHIRKFSSSGNDGNATAYIEQALKERISLSGRHVTDYIDTETPQADIQIGGRILENYYDNRVLRSSSTVKPYGLALPGFCGDNFIDETQV